MCIRESVPCSVLLSIQKRNGEHVVFPVLDDREIVLTHTAKKALNRGMMSSGSSTETLSARSKQETPARKQKFRHRSRPMRPSAQAESLANQERETSAERPDRSNMSVPAVKPQMEQHRSTSQNNNSSSKSV